MAFDDIPSWFTDRKKIIKHRRGLFGALSSLNMLNGELAFTTDTNELYGKDSDHASPYLISGLNQGAIADRPATGIADRQYFATDEGKGYIDDGATWHEVTRKLDLYTQDTSNVYIGVDVIGDGSATVGGSEDNTFIGSRSGYHLTTGDGNTLIGNYSAYDITTGSNNVILGYSAGQNVSTGGSNILIGVNAGATLSTGDNNIIIGIFTNVTGAAASDELNIGNAITGDLSTGDVTIANNLRVNGAFGINLDPLFTFHIAESGNSFFIVDSYSATKEANPFFEFRKSHNNSIGSMTETIDLEELGELQWRGVDSGGNFDVGFVIKAVQNGASGTRVPTNAYLETWSSTAENTDQLVLLSTGDITMSGSLTVDATFYNNAIDGSSSQIVVTNGNWFIQSGSGSTLKIGADVNAYTLTDNTWKFARMAMPHYDTGEQDVAIMLASCDATESYMVFGGGSSAVNAVESIRFYTAADTTTVTGTRRGDFDKAGDFNLVNNINVGAIANITTGINIGTYGVPNDSYINIVGASASDPRVFWSEVSTSYGFSWVYDGGDNKFYMKNHEGSAAGMNMLEFTRAGTLMTVNAGLTVTGFIGIEATRATSPLYIESEYDSHVGFGNSGVTAAGSVGGFGTADGGYAYVSSNAYIDTTGTLQFFNDEKPAWIFKNDGRTGVDAFEIGRAPANPAGVPTTTPFFQVDNTGDVTIPNGSLTVATTVYTNTIDGGGAALNLDNFAGAYNLDDDGAGTCQVKFDGTNNLIVSKTSTAAAWLLGGGTTWQTGSYIQVYGGTAGSGNAGDVLLVSGYWNNASTKVGDIRFRYLHDSAGVALMTFNNDTSLDIFIPLDMNSQDVTGVTNITASGTVFTNSIAGAASDVVFSNGDVYIQDQLGIGVSPDSAANLHVASGTASLVANFDTWSDTTARQSKFIVRKSHHDTIGTITETIDTEALGTFLFQGVDSNGVFNTAAAIEVEQTGAAGSGTVPASMTFRTQANSTQLVLLASGDNTMSGSLTVDGTVFTNSIDGGGSEIQVTNGRMTWYTSAKLRDFIPLIMGNNDDAYLGWIEQATPTDKFVQLAVDDTYHNFLIGTKTNWAYEYQHEASTDPSLFIHSHNASTDEWIGIWHDQTDGVISVGSGSINLVATSLNLNGAALYMYENDHILFNNDASQDTWITGSDNDIVLGVGSGVKLTIGSGDITIAGGLNLHLEEKIVYLGGTGANYVQFPDNLAEALIFSEGANPYVTFVTTDASEQITLHKETVLAAGFNLTLYNSIFFLGGSAANSLLIEDNHASALSVKEGANAYMVFRTVDGNERVTMYKQVQFESSLKIKEIAAAPADAAGYGQLWSYDNSGTTELWFTDDSGTDTKII